MLYLCRVLKISQLRGLRASTLTAFQELCRSLLEREE